MSEEIKPNKFAEKVSVAAAMVTFVGTFALLGVGLPVAGAVALGAAALHVGGGLLAAAGAVVGGIAGFTPFLVVDHYGHKKSPKTGTIELMTKPTEFAIEAVNCLLSPRYGLSKLKQAFSRSSAKPVAAPEAQPAAPAPTKPDAPTV